MATIELEVQNVKCGGCVSAIQEGLSVMSGIDTIATDIESGMVRISGEGFNESEVITKLSELGYPVVT